jgi:hypothetical protein
LVYLASKKCRHTKQMELQTMSLEKNGISGEEHAALRRASAVGTLFGMVFGVALGIVMFLGTGWAVFNLALPHSAHRVFVAIDPKTPGRVVRAEIDGWPLTPRLAGAAGIEFALERTNRRRSGLVVEFRHDDFTPPLRAAAVLERRRCDVVVVFDAHGGTVSTCVQYLNF